MKWKSLSRVWLFETPLTIQSWNSPSQNTGVGSCSLLWGIFPTQGSNPGLPHCRWILYQVIHQGKPREFPPRHKCHGWYIVFPQLPLCWERLNNSEVSAAIWNPMILLNLTKPFHSSPKRSRHLREEQDNQSASPPASLISSLIQTRRLGGPLNLFIPLTNQIQAIFKTCWFGLQITLVSIPFSPSSLPSTNIISRDESNSL